MSDADSYSEYLFRSKFMSWKGYKERRVRQSIKAVVTEREHLLSLFQCQAREICSFLFPLSVRILTEITLDNIADIRKWSLIHLWVILSVQLQQRTFTRLDKEYLRAQNMVVNASNLASLDMTTIIALLGTDYGTVQQSGKVQSVFDIS